MTKSLALQLFGNDLLTELQETIGKDRDEDYVERLAVALQRPPLETTLRVNTKQWTREQAVQYLCHGIIEPKLLSSALLNMKSPKVSEQSLILPDERPDLIILPVTGPHSIEPNARHSISVDPDCGAAVWRGAPIYAVGVLTASKYLTVDKPVNVYVDLDRVARKGMFDLPTDARKLYLGKGRALMDRNMIFGGTEMVPSGVAVEMTDCIYQTTLGLGVLVDESGLFYLQNNASMLVTQVLDPQPSDQCLDLCSAPGGKSTHIAQRLESGHVLCLERSASKVKSLQSLTELHQLTSVMTCLHHDSTVCSPEWELKFDKVVLDPPCTGLGRRPILAMRPEQWRNQVSREATLRACHYQKRLFQTAFRALKAGGVLVYSTCTLHVHENEEMVLWALNTFALQLYPHPLLSTPPLSRLRSDLYQSLYESSAVRRFDPAHEESIGFFIARFIKHN